MKQNFPEIKGTLQSFIPAKLEALIFWVKILAAASSCFQNKTICTHAQHFSMKLGEFPITNATIKCSIHYIHFQPQENFVRTLRLMYCFAQFISSNNSSKFIGKSSKATVRKIPGERITFVEEKKCESYKEFCWNLYFLVVVKKWGNCISHR